MTSETSTPVVKRRVGRPCLPEAEKARRKAEREQKKQMQRRKERTPPAAAGSHGHPPPGAGELRTLASQPLELQPQPVQVSEALHVSEGINHSIPHAATSFTTQGHGSPLYPSNVPDSKQISPGSWTTQVPIRGGGGIASAMAYRLEMRPTTTNSTLCNGQVPVSGNNLAPNVGGHGPGFFHMDYAQPNLSGQGSSFMSVSNRVTVTNASTSMPSVNGFRTPSLEQVQDTMRVTSPVNVQHPSNPHLLPMQPRQDNNQQASRAGPSLQPFDFIEDLNTRFYPRTPHDVSSVGSHKAENLQTYQQPTLGIQRWCKGKSAPQPLRTGFSNQYTSGKIRPGLQENERSAVSEDLQIGNGSEDIIGTAHDGWAQHANTLGVPNSREESSKDSKGHVDARTETGHDKGPTLRSPAFLEPTKKPVSRDSVPTGTNSAGSFVVESHRPLPDGHLIGKVLQADSYLRCHWCNTQGFSFDFDFSTSDDLATRKLCDVCRQEAVSKICHAKHDLWKPLDVGQKVMLTKCDVCGKRAEAQCAGCPLLVCVCCLGRLYVTNYPGNLDQLIDQRITQGLEVRQDVLVLHSESKNFVSPPMDSSCMNEDSNAMWLT